MARGTIDWKSTESYTRLLAAMVAAQDMKLNYKKIADMFGEGATYDSIEGRFRIVRKEAEKLKAEIESGCRAPAPARGTGSKTSTPKKPRAVPDGGSGVSDGVLSGRVTKNGSPIKRRSNKKEVLENSTSTSNSGDMTASSPSSGHGEHQGPSVVNLVDQDSFSTQFMSFADPAMYHPGGGTTNGHASHADPQSSSQLGFDYLEDGTWDVGV